LLAAGAALSIAGWTDIALFFWPPRFGTAEWEFAIIAQTFNALPLPTLGTALLALGMRARGGAAVWARTLAVIMALVAVGCLVALGIFMLDVPVALRAIPPRAPGPGAQAAAVMAAGIKRSIGKVFLFASAYAAAYAVMSVVLWRASRGARAPKQVFAEQTKRATLPKDMAPANVLGTTLGESTKPSASRRT
jgi:hypothetical protein